MKSFECPPVMICGFNRPACLKRVFEVVRQVKPEKLFLVLDAPRPENENDLKGLMECKQIFDGVDWPCEVHRNYAEKNMRCRTRMETGITWAFEYVDRLVILEDDCVPNLSFFRFCDEMLEKYRDDTRIGMVAGFREHPHLRQRKESYYFTRFTQIWGWATWKRAWSKYGKVLDDWDVGRARIQLEPIFRKKSLINQVSNWFDDAYAKRSNSWATVWWMSNVFESFLTIHPAVNLVTNVGVDGCHNSKFNPEYHNVPSEELKWPLVHPAFVMPDAIDEAIVRERMMPRHGVKGSVVLLLRKLGLRR